MTVYNAYIYAIPDSVIRGIETLMRRRYCHNFNSAHQHTDDAGNTPREYITGIVGYILSEYWDVPYIGTQHSLFPDIVIKDNHYNLKRHLDTIRYAFRRVGPPTETPFTIEFIDDTTILLYCYGAR